MKKLYDFNFDFGRMGFLQGLFTAQEEDVEDIIGKEVHFGEVLGKHSEVSGPIEEGDLKVISEDQEKIAWLEELMKGSTISGYNPFDYIDEDEDE